MDEKKVQKTKRQIKREKFQKSAVIKGKKEAIKISAFRKMPMSKQGRKHFSPKTRPFMKPWVYKHEETVRVPVSQISTKEDFEELIAELWGPGEFRIAGFSHGKNTRRVKWVTLAMVSVRQTRTGLKSTMTNYWRLSRYWFWKGTTKPI